ncbi:MAG TPA: DsbA family protein [Kofleriaceae bacterium]|nr:DsbA family protein [Kofleriaceae bacterium]
MGPTLSIAIALLLGTTAAACESSPDSEVVNQLKEMNKRLKSVEARLDASARGGGGPMVGERGGPGAPAAGAAGAGQRPPGPNPAEVYAVPIDGAPWEGARDAKVTIVKGYDYACPYCEKVRGTLDQLLADYRGDLKVVHKMLVVHPQVATLPAEAVCAANLQGKFEPMDDLVWDKGFKNNRDLSQENLDKLAAEAGLDLDRFHRDQAGQCKLIVAKDQTDLRKVGAGGTPSFFINGRFLSGARPIEQFKALIDEELKKANERISKGTPVRDYYRAWVLQKGKTSV